MFVQKYFIISSYLNLSHHKVDLMALWSKICIFIFILIYNKKVHSFQKYKFYITQVNYIYIVQYEYNQKQE